MAKYNGPVADAIKEIVDDRWFGGIAAEEAVEQIVDLVTGFMAAGWHQGQTLEQAMHIWQRGAVG